MISRCHTSLRPFLPCHDGLCPFLHREPKRAALFFCVFCQSFDHSDGKANEHTVLPNLALEEGVGDGEAASELSTDGRAGLMMLPALELVGLDPYSCYTPAMSVTITLALLKKNKTKQKKWGGSS